MSDVYDSPKYYELAFSYRLYPGYATTISKFDGEMSGYASGTRFVSSICGVLGLP